MKFTSNLPEDISEVLKNGGYIPSIEIYFKESNFDFDL